jgi:Arc/MetJ-type ribon-helix-helix transcriptional regulator
MAGETEKITINLGYVDLGQIDLLVQEGFYSNRTDFIRTATRNQLAAHAEVVRQTVARRTLVLGLQEYTRRDMEAVQAAGETLQIQVLGLAIIADDVPPELARATIRSVAVLGALRASPGALVTGFVKKGLRSSTQTSMVTNLPSRYSKGDWNHERGIDYGDGGSHSPHSRGPASRSDRPDSTQASGRIRAGLFPVHSRRYRRCTHRR